MEISFLKIHDIFVPERWSCRSHALPRNASRHVFVSLVRMKVNSARKRAESMFYDRSNLNKFRARIDSLSLTRVNIVQSHSPLES